MKIRILVTGGGSSGHISPALAIIQTLRDIAARSDFQLEFLYVGGKRGLEKSLVEAQNIPFLGVETGKLRRYFSRENFTDIARVPVGIAQSLRAVKKFAPDVVLATGGYVAVPTVLAARILRVPILIHEQTVQIGLANRIAARCATSIALSFPSALEELSQSQKRKAWISGNPVRDLIFNGDKAEGARLAKFEGEDLPSVYITGGSQGARVINRAVESSLSQLLQFCRIIHQCGQQPQGTEQDFDRLQQVAGNLPQDLQRRYHLTRFVGAEIPHVFALADLVVSRAGAGTIAEICALGKPAIYIPLVPTGGDEQTRNAQMCVEAGAAQIIAQSELDGDTLCAAMRNALENRAKLAAMGAAAQTLAKPDAARDLANAVLELAQKSTPE